MANRPNRVVLKISLILNLLLIVFLVIYFWVPFLNNRILTKLLMPCCGVIEKYQGEQYLPAWCQQRTQLDVVVEDKGDTEEGQKEPETTTQLANPAAVKCEEAGGKLEPFRSLGGEDALCVFKDGSICPEWDYFRGDCLPGKCFKECQAIGSRSEGWYNTCTKGLIKYEDCAPDQKGTDENQEEIKPVASNSIKLISPIANSQLSSPFKVEGQAIVKDNKVYIRVKNPAGEVLISESATAIAKVGSEWADFSIDIKYEFNLTKEGVVEVYSLDQNNQEVNLISIPVKF